MAQDETEICGRKQDETQEIRAERESVGVQPAEVGWFGMKAWRRELTLCAVCCNDFLR